MTLEAALLRDATALTLDWSLPDGGVLLGGPANESRGAHARGTTVTATRALRFDASGVYRIFVSARSGTDGAMSSATAALFFHVQAGGQARVTTTDERARAELDEPVPATVTLDESAVEVERARRAAGADASQADPCFIISGIVTRKDRPVTPTGYGPDVIVPVRFAEVEIREEDVLFDDSYATVLTNSEGRYLATFCDDDGPFDDTLEIYVRVHARLWRNGHKVVAVSEANSFLGIDLTALTTAYKAQTLPKSSSGGALSFNPALASNDGISSIFNIADAIYEGWQFWLDSGGERLTSTVDVLWEAGEGEQVSNYRGDFTTGRDIVIADDVSNAGGVRVFYLVISMTTVRDA